MSDKVKGSSVQNELIEREQKLALAMMPEVERYFLDPKERTKKQIPFINQVMKKMEGGVRLRSTRAREAGTMLRAMEMAEIGNAAALVLEHLGVEVAGVLEK